jgi:ribosomal protein S18 acetylase RimI-like enzyme
MADLLDYFVRPISLDDEPFLWQMLYQAIFVPEGQPAPPREIVSSPDLARYVSHWGQPDDSGLLAVATTRKEPLGAVWLRRFTKDNKGYGYLDDETPELSIALLPAYRNKGIGTRLLIALFDIAQNRYKAISLSVSADNPAARLYERLGFEIVRKDDASSIMKKSFAAPLSDKTA